MFEKPHGRKIEVLKFSRKADRLRLDGLRVDYPAVDLQYLETVACGNTRLSKLMGNADHLTNK